MSASRVPRVFADKAEIVTYFLRLSYSEHEAEMLTDVGGDGGSVTVNVAPEGKREDIRVIGCLAGWYVMVPAP